jgi:tetratricopeptide (TPR) repeat protein
MLSVEHLGNLIDKNKDKPATLMELANNILDDKDITKEHYELAFKAFDIVLKITPRNIQAIFGRGRAKALLGYTSGAFLDYNAVIQMRPEVSAAWFRRGLLYFQIKDYKSALMDFMQTIQLDHNFLEGYLLRAYTLMNLGVFDEAAHDLNHVIKFETSMSAEALYHRAGCFYNLQLMELAIKDCDNLLQIGWVTAEIYSLRAMAHLHFKDFEKALEDCESALKLAPENQDLIHNRGEVLKAIEQLKNEVTTETVV